MIVSIIVITKDNYKDLSFTLSSLDRITEKNLFEVVVVDSSILFEDAEYIGFKKSFLNFKLIREPRKGISLAFNVGIENASAGWVMFLNSGDELVNSSLIDIIRSQTIETKIAYGISEIFNVEKNIVVALQGSSIGKWPPLRMPYNHQSVFYRREVFEMIGGYDQNYKFAMDYAHLLHCKDIKLKFLNIRISRFYLGGASSNVNEVYKEWKNALIDSGYPPRKAKFFYSYYVIRAFIKKLLITK